MASRPLSTLLAIAVLFTILASAAVYAGGEAVVRAVLARPIEPAGHQAAPDAVVPYGMNGSYTNWDVYNTCDQLAHTFRFKLEDVPASAVGDTVAEQHPFATGAETLIEQSATATPYHTSIEWHNSSDTNWVALSETVHFGYQIEQGWEGEPGSVTGEWTLSNESPCPVPETSLHWWNPTPAPDVAQSSTQLTGTEYAAEIENRSRDTLGIQRRSMVIDVGFQLGDLRSQGPFSSALSIVDPSSVVVAAGESMRPHVFTDTGRETGFLMVYTVTKLIAQTPVPQYVAWEAIPLPQQTATGTPIASTVTPTPTPPADTPEPRYIIYLPLVYRSGGVNQQTGTS